MKYIIIITIALLTSCTAWEEYEWESDFFNNKFAIEEVPAPPVEKNPPVCNQCICNMDLCV